MAKLIERKATQRRNPHVSYRAPTEVRPAETRQVPPIRTIERLPLREAEAPSPKRFVRWLGLLAALVVVAGAATLAVRAAMQDDVTEIALAEQPWTPELRGLAVEPVTIDGFGEEPWTIDGRDLAMATVVAVAPAAPDTIATPWTPAARGVTTAVPRDAAIPWTAEARGLDTTAVAPVATSAPWTAEARGLEMTAVAPVATSAPWTAEARGLDTTAVAPVATSAPWTAEARGLDTTAEITEVYTEIRTPWTPADRGILASTRNIA